MFSTNQDLPRVSFKSFFTFWFSSSSLKMLPCDVFATADSSYIVTHSADPRLLGALRKTVSGGGGDGVGMDETHLSVFHSVSNRARGKRSRSSISSVARISSRFCFFVLSKSKRLDNIHVT